MTKLLIIVGALILIVLLAKLAFNNTSGPKSPSPGLIVDEQKLESLRQKATFEAGPEETDSIIYKNKPEDQVDISRQIFVRSRPDDSSHEVSVNLETNYPWYYLTTKQGKTPLDFSSKIDYKKIPAGEYLGKIRISEVGNPQNEVILINRVCVHESSEKLSNCDTIFPFHD